ncbi:hypothetical protein FHL15_003527 [Xylaria flabelliformis]|uniref:Uncharacterized protein n=1 Tax=Xylaria flabelliformis TaxID=2512241 RepID=A0A553I5T8_9PEZI|nr:hypothetical protein FHL15_003527 [Xylaria flabelliformis]
MQEVPAAVQAAQAATSLVYWQAFADEGSKIMTKEAELRAKYEQLYPLRPLEDVRQPNPVRFYGPGPDGRVHPRDPPVGTLHFARWRHELEAVQNPEDDGYHNEKNPPRVIKGQQNRPTYAIKGNQAAREVNYFLWEKVTVDSMREAKIYPGPKATRATHEEYLLNENDFNGTEDQKYTVPMDLDNRQDEDPEEIYPLGYQLLKKWSNVNGYVEWEEGMSLGPDPHSPDALSKHLGWFPRRFRKIKAGLGADPQDAIWNEVFHGNLNAKPKEKFVPPKAKWSEDPDKVTKLTSSSNCHMTLQIVSRDALKVGLPLPEPDTLNARKIWLDGRAPEKSVHRPTKAVVASQHIINKSTVLVSPVVEVMADTESAKGSDAKREKIGTEITEIAEQGKGSRMESGGKDLGRRPKYTSRDAANEEREAIETKLKELSMNPEPGHEGRRPIVIYSAFRSKFLGTPVTQVLGYEG